MNTFMLVRDKNSLQKTMVFWWKIPTFVCLIRILYLSDF